MRTVLFAFIVGVAVVASAHSQDSDRMIGTWKRTDQVAGFDLRLTVAREKNEWKLSFDYLRDGKVAGTSAGIDVKFADGGIYYFHKHVNKAIATWDELVPNKRHLRMKGDRLEVYEFGPNTVTSRYDRIAPPAEVAAGPDPFAGVWKGTYPGATTTILLKIAGSSKDGYAIEGFGIAPTGKIVGHFPAVDAEIIAGPTAKVTVDAPWEAFPGAKLTGTSSLALVRDAKGLSVSLGPNRSALSAVDAGEFAKQSAPPKTKTP